MSTEISGASDAEGDAVDAVETVDAVDGADDDAVAAVASSGLDPTVDGSPLVTRMPTVKTTNVARNA
ncbi:MAG: hypothetical protein ACFCVC_17075 [Acidimicrobiia bacterium]